MILYPELTMTLKLKQKKWSSEEKLKEEDLWEGDGRR